MPSMPARAPARCHQRKRKPQNTADPKTMNKGVQPCSRAAGAAAGTGFPPEVMNLPELAKYLRFSAAHTRKLADDGHLGGWKLGSAWRFRKTDIDRRLAGSDD